MFGDAATPVNGNASSSTTEFFLARGNDSLSDSAVSFVGLKTNIAESMEQCIDSLQRSGYPTFPDPGKSQLIQLSSVLLTFSSPHGGFLLGWPISFVTL